MQVLRINNVIIFGAISCFASATLFALDAGVDQPDRYSTVCQVRLWITSLSFTLSFGALFAKTLSVHRVFNTYLIRPQIRFGYLICKFSSIWAFWCSAMWSFSWCGKCTIHYQPSWTTCPHKSRIQAWYIYLAFKNTHVNLMPPSMLH